VYRNKVAAHGKEWKAAYSKLLIGFVQLKVFTPEIESALQKSIGNPAATANGETELLLILRQYNQTQQENQSTVLSLQEGALFQTDNGKIFRRGAVRRKRIDCEEISTKLHYIFSPIAVVKVLPDVFLQNK
jgi:hypothetical protein